MPRYRLAGVRARAPKSVDLATVALLLGIAPDGLSDLVLVRRSLDARQKPALFWELAVEFTSREPLDLAPQAPLRLSPAEPPPAPALLLPEIDTKAKVAVIGTGPAGLFAALALVDARNPRHDPRARRPRRGPLSQGHEVLDVRRVRPRVERAVRRGRRRNVLDGKLTCGKRHDKVKVVLETLHRFGAPASILVDAKPHIGTDRLVVVLRNVRKHLLENGATLRYRAKVTDLVTGKGGALLGLKLATGEEVAADVAVLALGHSARDTMDMLLARGVAMTRKHFAMGLRIEHPQDAVDLIQYAQVSTACGVMPADYKQAHVAQNGRGIYTFCMCPGGEVIACSSEAGGVVTNGMSRYKRGSGYANAGIVVQTRDEDFDAMGGPELLRGRELPAARRGRGVRGRGRHVRGAGAARDGLPQEPPAAHLAAPAPEDDVRAVGDGRAPSTGSSRIRTSRRSRTASGSSTGRCPGSSRTRPSSSRRSRARPRPCGSSATAGASRPTVRGLYPAGEGAGFAGGIVSAALDGLRVARHVRAKLAGETLAPEKATIFKGPEY